MKKKTSKQVYQEEATFSPALTKNIVVDLPNVAFDVSGILYDE